MAKRKNISKGDLKKVADDFAIENPVGIINEVLAQKTKLIASLKACDVPKKVIKRMSLSFGLEKE